MGADLTICAACGNEIAGLARKCTVRGVPGHFHAGCAAQGRMIRNLYRAGLLEAAVIARNSCLVEPDGGAPTEDERLTAERTEERIRARITALIEHAPPVREGAPE